MKGGKKWIGDEQEEEQGREGKKEMRVGKRANSLWYYLRSRQTIPLLLDTRSLNASWLAEELLFLFPMERPANRGTAALGCEHHVAMKVSCKLEMLLSFCPLPNTSLCATESPSYSLGHALCSPNSLSPQVVSGDGGGGGVLSLQGWGWGSGKQYIGNGHLSWGICEHRIPILKPLILLFVIQ